MQTFSRMIVCSFFDTCYGCSEPCRVLARAFQTSPTMHLKIFNYICPYVCLMYCLRHHPACLVGRLYIYRSGCCRLPIVSSGGRHYWYSILIRMIQFSNYWGRRGGGEARFLRHYLSSSLSL